jgi:hypothetical protein
MTKSSSPIVRILCPILIVLPAACQTPVGVRRANPTQVERELTGDILSSGRLGVATPNALHSAAVEAEYASDPNGVSEGMEPRVLSGSLRGDEKIPSFFAALAKLSFSSTLTGSASAKTARNHGSSRPRLRTLGWVFGEVSAYADALAEREGFEPSIGDKPILP